MIYIFSAIFFFLLSKSFAACPNGWINGTSSNFCYKAINNSTYWVDADYNCILLGGHLASVDSAFLNTLLNSEAKKSFDNDTEFWLGSTTMIADGQWSWSDGSNSNYVNWANGQPTSNTGDNCATQQFSDGRWYTQDCYLTRRPYFCEMSQVVTPCPILPTPIGNNFTAGEWIYDETVSKCYLLLSYSFAGYPRFDISRQFCKSYGADDLVSIMSENENTAIGGYVVPFSLANHWFANDAAMIGLLNNGTGWQWVNGQKVSYTNWLSEPNSTSYGWARLEYGYKAGYRNQWDLGGTFLYDGCAVIICEKVIQKN